LRSARRDTRRHAPPRSARAAVHHDAARRRRCGPGLCDRGGVRESVEAGLCGDRAHMFGDGGHSNVFGAGKTMVLAIPRAISSSGLRGRVDVDVGMHWDVGVRPWMAQGSSRGVGMRGNVMMACDGAVAREVARVPGSRTRRRVGA